MNIIDKLTMTEKDRLAYLLDEVENLFINSDSFSDEEWDALYYRSALGKGIREVFADMGR